MLILQTKNIYKSYGSTEVLNQINLQVRENERVGLVGANGAGKTTLLKIITGEIQPDDGEIILSKKARIGYLAQNSKLDSSKTIWDELNQVFSDLKQMEADLRQLENKMGQEHIFSNEKLYQKTLEKYASLQEAYEEKGGYSYEARIRGTLHGLGIGHLDPHTTRIHELSGGQKTRVALAKMLLEEPGLLILDEPTNYLDIAATEWLEHTLSNYKGAVLLVSHDRYFLDRLVSVIYEIEQHQATRYVGNYTDYMVQKEERIHAQLKAYEEQQVEIKKMEDFIQKNIARASTTKRAQSRRKTLEKMERLEKPLIQNKQAAIRFDTAVSSGKQVLEVKDLSVGYEKPLLKNLSFRLERGEHVAIIGPNGIGKSTLLKTLVGHLPSLDGEMKWGVQVQMDYYDQEQKELNPEKQVIDEIWDYHPHLDQTTIRSYLGQFLFSGEDVFKKVSDLSGGEKARLSLLKRLLNQANFLLMDEPTNHLDMFSKERLEQALENFPGTLLFISHDRYFINRLANRVWEISSEGIKDYPGSYEWYLEKKALEKLEETTGVPEEEATHSSAQTYRQQEKELRRQQKKQQQKIMELEKDIIEIEERIAEIHELLCNPNLFSDPLKSSELKQELEQLENKLTLKTDEWAELADT
ncbi:ABC-F family ATP-binding cassette domain-containing protein [Thermoflavimicrobium daqui]|uniref:ABC transporter ATP-binding protein n=1 Tax=Thermoflavimicrobium daqui TaxID=2137476 RepID=A0A364K1X4_9BACL|nr:ABC-F family ATP-binding cassette domain-containing protein [Thermoflavimicrobium daqui]RAL22024.1 ABC transporter ATP-binding protein [Thermoflavimicrobium daqui]